MRLLPLLVELSRAVDGYTQTDPRDPAAQAAAAGQVADVLEQIARIRGMSGISQDRAEADRGRAQLWRILAAQRHRVASARVALLSSQSTAVSS